MKESRENKGFTLVELLAVIVILAVLALVATPIIIRIIENSRQNVFKNSVEGMIRTVVLDSNNNNYEGDTYSVIEGSIKNSKGNKIYTSGGTDENGTIIVEENGGTNVAVHNTKWCALKKTSEKKLAIKTYKDSECQIADVLTGGAKKITDKSTSGNTEGLFNMNNAGVRYRGSNSTVKNYVTFNGETWRIIGVMDKSLKLIKDTRLSNSFYWGSSNNWAESSLKDYLNGEYYNSLSSTARSMIKETTYHIGGITALNVTPELIYASERSSVSMANGNPNTWTGKIALEYLSDYGYAADPNTCDRVMQDFNMCASSNWLYKDATMRWILASFSTNGYGVCYIDPDGKVNTISFDSHYLKVRPVLYLKGDVEITAGTGTSASPYQLSL